MTSLGLTLTLISRKDDKQSRTQLELFADMTELVAGPRRDRARDREHLPVGVRAWVLVGIHGRFTAAFGC